MTFCWCVAASKTKTEMRRIVVVGGVAGGATCAARLSRLSPKTTVTVVERGPDVSFANCGLPYFIGGEIKDRSRLLMQTPSSLEHSLGIKVHSNTTATNINATEKVIHVNGTSGSQSISYDVLVLSPGAQPIVPAIPGSALPAVLTLRTLQDMDKIVAACKMSDCQHVTVVGGGFIGLEMVEQLHRAGKKVTLIERAAHVLPQVDGEIAQFLETSIVSKGVEILTSDSVTGIEKMGSDSSLAVTTEAGRKIRTNLVVMSIGVRPDTSLAKEAGLTLSQSGHIRVNDFMQSSDSSIYAVGDAVATRDAVFPHLETVAALGNVANMQARIAADHACTGKSIPYRGSLGTAIVRAMDGVVAVTGWTAARLTKAGIPFSSSIITADNHAGYYPGALPITMKLTFDETTGRIFGAQAFGYDGVDKRIDVVATAIMGRLTIDDLSITQLTYSPPFGSARDVVNVAALAARNVRAKLMTPVASLPKDAGGCTLIDVRPKDNAKLDPIANSINLPMAELRDSLPTFKQEHRSTEPLLMVCGLGKTSYFAERLLVNEGFSNVTCLAGGLRVARPAKPVFTAPPEPAAATHEQSKVGPDVTVDCCGLSCPGPLLKLKSAVAAATPGTRLVVTATDPGFAADVRAFCVACKLEVVVTVDKGTVVATVTVPRAGQVEASSATQAGTPQRRKGATIVVFSQDMDKVLAAFVIANGAAAMGGEVTMFFTFWGLMALRDPNGRARPPKSSFLDAMFGWMLPNGMKRLPMSNMNFAGVGPKLMRYQMATKDLPNLEDLLKSAREQKIQLVACTMSMNAMGITPGELIDGVKFGGVAEYLAAAETSGTNLFI